MTADTDREPTAGPDSVEARLRALRADVELLDQVVRDFLEPAAAAPPGPPGPRFEPCYPSVEAWVVGQFAPTYARPLSPAVRWCARWWDPAEAISRLEALWRVWEVARLDELSGIAVWYRDFLDPQLAVLLGSGGPFAQCTVDRHTAAHRARTRGVVGRGRTRRRAAGRERRMRADRPLPGAGGSGSAPPRRTER